MNIRENFAYGSTSDGDGALIDSASDNSNVGGIGDSVHCVTFEHNRLQTMNLLL